MNNNVESTLKTIAGTVAVMAVLAVIVALVTNRGTRDQVVAVPMPTVVIPTPVPTFTLVAVKQVKIDPTATHTLQPTSTRTPISLPTAVLPTANTNANVRGGPSTRYTVVGSVRKGDTLNVIGMNHMSDAPHIWLKLATGNWIRGDLVDNEKEQLSFHNAPPLPTPIQVAVPTATHTPVVQIEQPNNAPAPRATAILPNHWQYFTSQNVSGKLTGYRVNGEVIFGGAWGDDFDPKFTIRCSSSGKKSVYFVVDEYLVGEYEDDKLSVEFRHEWQESSVGTRWHVQDEQEFAVSIWPDAEFVYQIANLYRTGSNLYVSFQDYIGDRHSSKFNLTGIGEVLRRLPCF